MTKPPNPYFHFHPYGAVHFCVLAVFALIVALMVVLRRTDDIAHVRPRRRFMDRSIGWIGLGVAIFVQTVTLWPSRFDHLTSLPIQICDLVMFIAPLGLITGWRPLRALAYFWGLGLTSIAFIWPDLSFGPVYFQFWVFWAAHAAILATALYDVTARGFRPNRSDWMLAVACCAIYTAIIFPIDAVFSLNYGYVGKTYHGEHSPTDFLGPWPWRVAIMLVLAAAVMSLLFVPWIFVRRNRRSAAQNQTLPAANAAV